MRFPWFTIIGALSGGLMSAFGTTYKTPLFWIMLTIICVSYFIGKIDAYQEKAE